jgi:N-acylneuraminate cytidylyltransferase
VKPLCVVPARGGSKRFPRKNVAPLAGKPLLAWTIEPALASGLFGGDVWVSSEDEAILAEAERWGGRPLPRDGSLAGDVVSVVDVALDALDRVGGDADALYLMLPTSPLRRPETIRRAWAAFEQSGAEALLSIVPLEYPSAWALGTSEDGSLRPLDPVGYDTPRQRLTPAYRHDGGHAIVATGPFRARRELLAERTVAFEPPEEETVDVDNEIDLAWAEFLLARRTG